MAFKCLAAAEQELLFQVRVEEKRQRGEKSTNAAAWDEIVANIESQSGIPKMPEPDFPCAQSFKTELKHTLETVPGGQLVLHVAQVVLGGLHTVCTTTNCSIGWSRRLVGVFREMIMIGILPVVCPNNRFDIRVNSGQEFWFNTNGGCTPAAIYGHWRVENLLPRLPFPNCFPNRLLILAN
ncbi:hypothetical protein B0H11DRAFT_1899036 [Mycena galericulata]|nr:hypothetical protein B0H11DRAFT_1899036 [Mycena galericulata]